MSKNKLLLLLFCFVLISIIIASCSGRQYQSNGERIYFTATSSSGKPITSEGFVMMHGRFSCSTCHGEDGHGGSVHIMMFSFKAPNITWPELTGSHEDHAPYTESTIKEAITKGIEPNGEELEVYMPRWQMIDKDLDDLIGYLKTLN